MSKLKLNESVTVGGTATLEASSEKLDKPEKPEKNHQSKALLNKFIEEETKLVKGVFRNFETPGGSSRIQVRKYPGIPMFDMVMEDGKTYEVPLYIARHLNGTDVTAEKAGKRIHTCAYPTHGFKMDSSGTLPMSEGGDAGVPVPIVAPVKWTRRYAFESLAFDAGE
jgi:hypothetical protein